MCSRVWRAGRVRRPGRPEAPSGGFPVHVILTVDVESYTGDYEREVFAAGLGLDFILQC